MSAVQRTLKKEVTYTGIGLHTGAEGRVRLVPAPAGSGIRFVRVDKPGHPSVKLAPENAHYDSARGRRTILGQDGVEFHTVEHLLAALAGLGVDNLTVEVDSAELPEPKDGSAAPLVELCLEAGLEDQVGPRNFLVVDSPVSYTVGDIQLLAVPYDGLKISFTILYDDEFVRTQHASFDIDSEVFIREIAPARTFVLERDLEALRARGLIQGGRPESGVVVLRTGIANAEPLRFPDEFVRHKILDLLGDLYLLGRPVRGHFIAVRSGHESNVQFVRRIAAAHASRNGRPALPAQPAAFDIQQIMEIMPHRYPILLVDRILELEPGKRVVGIKNVTINEPCFQGHFPGRPVMPGVLIVEAMAQCGGFLLLNTMADPRNNLVYFLAIENARFRRMVIPGDTLRLEVEMLKLKSRMCKVRAKAFVGAELAAEAELLTGIIER